MGPSSSRAKTRFETGETMTQGQGSPVVENRGTHETKRIVLTRAELIKILFRFVDFVKDKEAKEFPGWVDGVFVEAERDGAIVFEAGGIPGRRFA